MRARPVAAGERLRRRLCAGRRNRDRRRRPARPLRDPEHLPEDEDEEEREHEEGDSHGCPPPTAGARASTAGRVAEKRNRPDDGDRCQNRASREDEEQAVGDAGVQDAPPVEPVLRRRRPDQERAREHADHRHPGAALHRPRPEECRGCQQGAQPAVVRPLDPVEGQVVLGEPRAEHSDGDGHDRDPDGDAVQDRPVRDEGVAHVSRPFARHAARGLRLS